MAKTKRFNPLTHVPTAGAIRERLAIVREEERRLLVLLKTAEEIEDDPRYVTRLPKGGVKDDFSNK
jgi:hypothetical protein